ncbi:MAG: tRNA threonylcarbamoyladenosine biosynthesis protein TsaB [Bacteroidota bacterium]
MAYALDLPVITIDSLEALAVASISDREKAIYIPMIDARRMEVYTAVFDQQGAVLSPPHAKIIDENSFQPWVKESYTIVLSGNGAQKCRTILTNSCFIYTDILNEAENMATLAWKSLDQKNWSDLAYFEPSYIKPPNITVSKKKL